MNTSRSLLKFASLACILSLSPLLNAAVITYLDASDSNTVSSSGTPADGGWNLRSFANSNTVYEGEGLTGDTDEELTTTISGLNPGSEYEISVFYWDAGDLNDWRILAGLNPNPTQVFTSDTGPSNVSLASDSTYTVDPLFTESDRTLYRAVLGTATASGAGEISVYIRPQPEAEWPAVPSNDLHLRTWYDGVGTAVIPEPSTFALFLVSASAVVVGFARRRS